MRIELLLALLSVSECISTVFVGLMGQNITLPCYYDIKHHGERSICWNRGEIPSLGCNNLLISTDGFKVKQDVRGSRFQLLGRLDRGDVSLTVLNLTEDDAGRYGCRVDIYGLFNDEKHYSELTVNRAPQTTAWTEGNTETTTQQTIWTPGRTTPENNATSPNNSFNSVEAEVGRNSSVVLVSVLLGLVALTTACGVIVMVRRWRKVTKMPQVNTTIQFTSTLSTLHLQSRGSVVDNIYQIDESTACDYEYCP
ncbi:T-cell immunoglobulin and mucin domain-containing protein 4-like [Betta splendens]|uniref:T-cell immunoglobulin and mucin domain-containing protein 4-like n=1 Tax=Betta splendens TaxID=158456 RepID=UPI0010F4CA42|nr:T-cell immunoglobulin and mucin domain-containing protein 4-like [Betta splendens]